MWCEASKRTLAVCSRQTCKRLCRGRNHSADSPGSSASPSRSPSRTSGTSGPEGGNWNTTFSFNVNLHFKLNTEQQIFKDELSSTETVYFRISGSRLVPFCGVLAVCVRADDPLAVALIVTWTQTHTVYCVETDHRYWPQCLCQVRETKLFLHVILLKVEETTMSCFESALLLQWLLLNTFNNKSYFIGIWSFFV